MTATVTKKTGNPGLLDEADIAYPVGSHVLTVGAGKTFGTVAAAIAASRDGDVILVDAGTYTNDFATVTTKISIIGVGGMVNMVATVPPPNLKGILTVDNDVTIKNLSFSGSAIPDDAGGNGAGIRYEGGHMVLVNDAFIGNQNGILAAGVIPGLTNSIEIDHSLFSGNGSGTGYTHNLYVASGIASLVATNSVFEGANVGHELKSRAESNLIENNVFRDGPTGTASYDIDLPNGGASTIRNNVIEKGPQAENNMMVHFGGEGIPYAGSSLLVEGNMFLNDKGAGVVGVLNQTAISVTVQNNTFSGLGANNLLAGPGSLAGNVDQAGNPIADATLAGVLPGSTAVFTDTADHQVVLDYTLQAVQGGAGHLTVQAAGGHVIAIGGAGGMDYQESLQSGGNQITTAAGSVNTLILSGQDQIDSRGTDRIVGGLGNLSGQISGNAVIDVSADDSSWSVLGTAAITGHGGNTFIDLGSKGQATVTGTLNYFQLTNNGGAASLDATIDGKRMSMSMTGGASSTRTYDGRLNIATAAGSQGTLLRMGYGDATIMSQGKDTIWAGSGSETVIISGQAEVHAGTGALAVFGRGIGAAGATVYGNGGSYAFDGDTGNITYYGGDLASTVQAMLSNITLVGGAGRLTVNGGSRETIVGGAGGLTYDSLGGGANTIRTAAGSTNSLVLAGASTINSWGKDTIFGGTGNQTMTVHGDAVITGSTGNSSLTLMGNDTLYGRGYDQVTVTKGANVTISTGTLTTVRETDAKVTFTGPAAGGGNTVIKGGGASISGGAGRTTTIQTDAGRATNVTLGAIIASVQSQGADQIHTGAANATVTLTGAKAELWAGSGATTVYNRAGDGVKETIHGGKGGLTLTQGGEATTFIGGSGAAKLDGAWGSLNVVGGTGAISITGAELGLRFIGGSGDAMLSLNKGANDITFGAGNTTAKLAVDWGNANTFHFVNGQGGGIDAIYGFRVGKDHLDLQGGVGVQSRSLSGGSANFVLTDGTHLQLVGVTSTGNSLFT